MNEMIGVNKRGKQLFLGYKLHLVDDCEIGLPVATKVETTNVNYSQPFYRLFPHITKTSPCSTKRSSLLIRRTMQQQSARWFAMRE